MANRNEIHLLILTSLQGPKQNHLTRQTIRILSLKQVSGRGLVSIANSSIVQVRVVLWTRSPMVISGGYSVDTILSYLGHYGCSCGPQDPPEVGRTGGKVIGRVEVVSPVRGIVWRRISLWCRPKYLSWVAAVNQTALHHLRQVSRQQTFKIPRIVTRQTIVGVVSLTWGPL